MPNQRHGRRWMIFLVILLAGCATVAQQGAYDLGLAQKAEAEALYQAIYGGYRDGVVPETEMQAARRAYAAFAQAQIRYIQQAQAGSVEPATLAAVQLPLAELRLIARTQGVARE